jgi:ornithine carbamoyltransferase
MAEAPAGVVLHREPAEAVREADVICTDVWVSVGQEAERVEKMKRFKGYQVNQALIDLARKDVIVMHCLPVQRGKEVTAEVIDGPRSVDIGEAENRLHAQRP